ncbi:hypothetical protein EYF80_007812 [Liparis tanakae]|uniref:Uncharacterized protein n=1 Tax=Liparis tanakae TaxID=230148 RepID=A0A4Z2IWH2_9TELE|nr:hypothetical protein EYF80_007812 [Liparis tanakae]
MIPKLKQLMWRELNPEKQQQRTVNKPDMQDWPVALRHRATNSDARGQFSTLWVCLRVQRLQLVRSH